MVQSVKPQRDTRLITQSSKRKDDTYNESAPSAGSLNRLFFTLFFFSQNKKGGCEKVSLTWRPAPVARPLGQPGGKHKTGGGENLQISLAELGGVGEGWGWGGTVCVKMGCVSGKCCNYS